MDNMTYTYKDGSSNQLAAVTDGGDINEGFKDGNTTGDDYLYDANGNLTSDLNKGIANIEYNHLNLTVKVTKDANNYIEYIYDAAGIKLAQVVHQESSDVPAVPLPVKTTYYMGEFIYEKLDANPMELQLINHEEGRVVKDDLSNWEYQYHLKDHLGNVRVTFTTKGPETLDYMATMEPEKAVKEEAEFVNADQRISGQSGTSNTTLGGNYSSYADSGKPVGVGIMLEVAKGDVLDISVNAYYSNATSDYSTLNAIGSALAAAFGGIPGGTAEQQVLYNSLTGAFSAFGQTNNSNPSEPAAYLNYYFFDKDMAFIERNSGYKRVSYLADGSPELISQLKTVDNTGFVYIFVSNLSPSTGDERVYFDDLNVKHTKNSKIVQSDDYYPFGLSFNSWQRSGSLKNKLNTFQDQELIEDLDLGWVQFKWRNHMPEIGRFFNVDPLAEKYVYNSPYAFSENKVVAHVELEGLESARAINNRRAYFNSSVNFQRVNQRLSVAASNYRNGIAGTSNRRQIANFTKSVVYNTGRGIGRNATASNEYGRSRTTTGDDNTHGNGTRTGQTFKLAVDIGNIAKDIIDKSNSITVSEHFVEAGPYTKSLGIDISLDTPEATLQLINLEKAWNDTVYSNARGDLSNEEWNNLGDIEKLAKIGASMMAAGPSPFQLLLNAANEAEENGEVEKENVVRHPTIRRAR